MKIATRTTMLALVLFCSTAVNADSFGSGANAFDIDFVTIGNPNNSDDITGNPNPAGKVEYTYRMGQFEISEDMVNKANALGGLGLTHDNNGANKPATSMTWYEAAHFINWLNTDNGGSPAYKFDSGGFFQLWQSGDAGYNSANPYRNTEAGYYLPSMDEWYKAAYFDSTTNSYGDYPSADGSQPTAVGSGAAANTAVYDQPFAAGPADILLAGGMSPSGTVGQGGNVWEWEETDYDLMNGSGLDDRGFRGGSWRSNFANLRSLDRGFITPTRASETVGFRVASNIPEPSTVLLASVAACFGLLMPRRRNGAKT